MESGYKSGLKRCLPGGACVLPDLVPGVEVDGGGGEGELLVPGQEGGLQGPALLGRVGVPGAPVVLPLPNHRVPDQGCQLGTNILQSVPEERCVAGIQNSTLFGF
jgi:hypothetical protein